MFEIFVSEYYSCKCTLHFFLQAFLIVCKVDCTLSSFFLSFFTFLITRHVIASVIRTSMAHVIRTSIVHLLCYSFDYMTLVHRVFQLVWSSLKLIPISNASCICVNFISIFWGWAPRHIRIITRCLVKTNITVHCHRPLDTYALLARATKAILAP